MGASADIVGFALVRAARALNRDPQQLLEGSAAWPMPVRQLAGAALRKAGLADMAADAGRLVSLNPNLLAPSHLAKSHVSTTMVEVVADALRRAATTPRAVEKRTPIRPAEASSPSAAVLGSTDVWAGVGVSPSHQGGAPLADYLSKPPTDAPVIRPSARTGARAATGELPGRDWGLSERDLRLATQDHDFVQRKRAAGVPWAHIANQLVVGVQDLRRRHDPDFQPISGAV